MRDSTFDSFQVPHLAQRVTDAGITPGQASKSPAPIVIAQANDVPLRVAAACTSVGADAQLSFDSANLQNFPAMAGTYRLQSGKDQTFVLAPGQRLYASSPSVGCAVSVHVSEAWPEVTSKRDL